MTLPPILLRVLVTSGALTLAACSEQTSPPDRSTINSDRKNEVAAPAGSRPAEARRAEPPPFLAVNALKQALLPLGPTMGDVAVEKNCVAFTRRGGASTPLWPFGTRLVREGGAWAVNLPDGRSIALPSRATLTGAEVPLNSSGMTRFSGALGKGCPRRIYAVALN
ncbi:MAG TPA: hypothetical protein VGB65_02215 [Allosphingosinicella sp.]|jgi:hypothetical protein